MSETKGVDFERFYSREPLSGEFALRVTRRGNSYYVKLPLIEFIRYHGLKSGDYVNFKATDCRRLMEPDANEQTT